MDSMRKAMFLLCLGVIAGCGGSGGDAPGAPSDETPVSVASGTSTVEDRADLSGLPPAAVGSLEDAGVRVAPNGELWAEECSDARSVRVPAGKRIIC